MLLILFAAFLELGAGGAIFHSEKVWIKVGECGPKAMDKSSAASYADSTYSGQQVRYWDINGQEMHLVGDVYHYLLSEHAKCSAVMQTLMQCHHNLGYQYHHIPEDQSAFDSWLKVRCSFAKLFYKFVIH